MLIMSLVASLRPFLVVLMLDMVVPVPPRRHGCGGKLLKGYPHGILGQLVDWLKDLSVIYHVPVFEVSLSMYSTFCVDSRIKKR